VDDRGKIHQKGITNRFNHCAMIRRHGLLDDLVMRLQQSQRTSFIGAHLATKADDVGEHDRRQLASFGLEHRRASLRLLFVLCPCLACQTSPL
jgi:hypothetical protein